MKTTILKNVSSLVMFFALAAGTAISYSCTKDDTPADDDNGKTGTETVSVTGVSLDKTTLTLNIGESATLNATVAPSDATNKKVTWTSDKESVATVSDGKVTAVAAGECQITVTTEDGSKTATCAVTVNGGSGSEVSDSWEGTWEVTSTQTVTLDAQANISVSDTPQTFSIAIQKVQLDESTEGYLINGWSKLLDNQGNSSQGLAVEDENGNLVFLSDVPMGSVGTGEDKEDVVATWLPIAKLSDNTYSWITKCEVAMSFAKDGNTATATNASGTLTGGKTFTVCAFDVFGLGNYIYTLFNLPIDLPGGEFSMVKKSDDTTLSSLESMGNAGLSGEKCYTAKLDRRYIISLER